MNIIWIPVTDMLPAKRNELYSVNVLVVTEDDEYKVAYYTYKSKVWCGSHDIDSVIAWAYIPMYESPAVAIPIDQSVSEGYVGL